MIKSLQCRKDIFKWTWRIDAMGMLILLLLAADVHAILPLNYFCSVPYIVGCVYEFCDCALLTRWKLIMRIIKNTHKPTRLLQPLMHKIPHKIYNIIGIFATCTHAHMKEAHLLMEWQKKTWATKKSKHEQSISCTYRSHTYVYIVYYTAFDAKSFFSAMSCATRYKIIA